MADKFGEFSFLQEIHLRTYKRIDTSISIRSMTIKFGKQVHLEELRQMKLTKEVLVTPSRRNHVALKRCYNIFLAKSLIHFWTKHLRKDTN